MGQKENSVKRACLNTLHANNIMAWLYNNQATPIFRKRCVGGCWLHVLSGWRKNYYSRTGVADIIGILPGSGRALFVEAKQGKGKQQQNQIDFEKDAKAQGAVYIVARSVEEMREKLNAEGVILIR